MDFHLFNILLVENDQYLGPELFRLLKSSGHNVTHCVDGDHAFEAFCNGRHNFCVFDLMLPGIDGFTLTERVRRRDTEIPIIIITQRFHKDDKHKAFDLGVDDYIVKPFDPDELLWRITAVSRRVLPSNSHNIQKNPLTRLGIFTIDFSSQFLRSNANTQRLTRRENEVLHMLCKHKNQLIKREKILMRLWGDVDYFHGRSLDVFISKLRRYLKSDSRLKIENIPTVGYILREDVDQNFH